MAEVDPVVFEYIAKVDKYVADVRRTTRTVDQQLGLQEKRVRSLENEFRSSSSRISSTLRGLAGTFAAAFTARELSQAIDSFTRLQNSLRVAGLEGEELADVQERLYQIGGRYGVSVNSLADLFGKATQIGREFGASQEDLLGLTEAVSQSLIVSGKSTQQASGAILGLTQALASGTVRTEEYNQINEGGLRPLLEAAAAAERFGGNVNRLQDAIRAGTVSSKEFYDAIQANANIVAGKAATAALTLEGAVQSLSDAFNRYVGEAAEANGVTSAVADGIQALADNLDVVIPALATLAAVIGVRTVASAVAGSNAVFALSAAMGGAATATEALTFAMRGLSSVGVVAVITGLVLVLEKARQRSLEAARATGEYARQQEALSDIQDRARQVTDELAAATGRAREEALANARALREETLEYHRNAEAALIAARAKAQQARRDATTERNVTRNVGGSLTRDPFGGTGIAIAGPAQHRETRADINLRVAQQNVERAEQELADLEAIINANAPSAGGAAARTASSRSTRARGPSADEIADRFESELDGLRSQLASAIERNVSSADDLAEERLKQVENARRITLRSLEADEDYTDAQKDRLAGIVDLIVAEERLLVERERQAQIEQEAQELADERFRAEQDALRLQFDLADTQAERRDIALEILAAEDRYLRSKLEAITASETATEAEKQRAALALQSLEATAGARRDATGRANETDTERYLRSLNKTPGQINEALNSIQMDALDALNDGLVDAILNAESLGDVFSSVADQIVKDLLRIAIQQAVIQPLANSLFGGLGGGGIFGIIGGLFGSIFGGGRASGGPVSSGTPYLVGERGPEMFVPGASGSIVPNQRLASAGGAGGTATVRLELSGDLDARIERVSGPVAVEVVRVASGPLTERAVNETFRRSSRPSL